jgi:hypothetical protein
MKKNSDKRQNAANGIHVRQNIKVRTGARQKNGFVHVASPATASEIRRTLGITKTQIRNVRRAFLAAGIKI